MKRVIFVLCLLYFVEQLWEKLSPELIYSQERGRFFWRGYATSGTLLIRKRAS